MVTTESLFCSPRAFGSGIAAAGGTPSPVQRAICRAADGLPLGDLADDPAVIRAFGGQDAVAQLPDEPPKELYCVCCIRGGKSLLAACLAFKIAFTTDLSFMAKREIARVSCVSVSKDLAGAVMGHLMVALELENGVLGQYLVKSPRATPERVRIRRPDGRVVEIVISAGKRGGASLVSRWTLAAIMDEACRMVSNQSDGVVNFSDMRSGVIGRLSLVRGGQLIVVSSPWVADGPIYEAVRKHHGRPTRHLVVVRAPGPDMNPAVWTPAAVAAMRSDPAKEQEYLSDALGEFVNIESGWLLADDIDKALGRTNGAPGRTEETLQRDPRAHYCAAMDPGLKSNSWTLVIVAFWPSEDGDASGDRYAVAHCCQWTGTRKNPLNVAGTLADVKTELRAYGIDEAWTDQWGAEFITQSGDTVGVSIHEDRAPATEKDQRHVTLKATMIAGHFQATPHDQWRADMLAARLKRTAASEKLELPLTRDGRHCDFVPATVLAFAKASSGPSWADRIDRWNQNGRRVVF